MAAQWSEDRQICEINSPDPIGRGNHRAEEIQRNKGKRVEQCPIARKGLKTEPMVMGPGYMEEGLRT